MPVDDDVAATNKPDNSAIRTTSDGTLISPQRLRIHVPTANAEIVLGLKSDNHLGIVSSTSTDVFRTAETLGVKLKSNEKVIANTAVAMGVNEKGFVGLLTTVDHGNVFICSATMGGANLGSSYNHTARVGTIIETGIAVVRAGLLWWAGTYSGQHAGIQDVLLVGQGLWAAFNAITSPMSGSDAGLANMDYLKTGHIGLFGARSVKLESIEGVASSAAMFNTMSGGLSASVNSIVATSLNSGTLASVNAGFSASLNAPNASVVGALDAGLSSRIGTARVEGYAIRIGNKRQAGGKAKALTGVQDMTNEVWIRADDFVEVATPGATQPPWVQLTDDTKDGHLIGLTKHPIGLQIAGGHVRLNNDLSAVRLGRDVTTLAGTSMMRASSKGVELGVLKVAPMTASNNLLNAARTAYHTAWTASEGVSKQVDLVLKKAKAKGILGTIAAVAGYAVTAGVVAGAGAGLGALAAKEEGEEAGADEGAKMGAAAGGVIGVMGVMLGVSLVAMKAAGAVQRAGQKAAMTAYTTGIQAALAAEVGVSVLDPTAPKVEVTASGVKLCCGANSITVSKTGVDIVAPKVTINGVKIGPGLAPPLPPIPIVVGPPPPRPPRPFRTPVDIPGPV